MRLEWLQLDRWIAGLLIAGSLIAGSLIAGSLIAGSLIAGCVYGLIEIPIGRRYDR